MKNIRNVIITLELLLISNIEYAMAFVNMSNTNSTNDNVQAVFQDTIDKINMYKKFNIALIVIAVALIIAAIIIRIITNKEIEEHKTMNYEQIIDADDTEMDIASKQNIDKQDNRDMSLKDIAMAEKDKRINDDMNETDEADETDETDGTDGVENKFKQLFKKKNICEINPSQFRYNLDIEGARENLLNGFDIFDDTEPDDEEGFIEQDNINFTYNIDTEKEVTEIEGKYSEQDFGG